MYHQEVAHPDSTIKGRGSRSCGRRPARRIAFRNTKERKPRTVRVGADLLSVLFSLPSKPGPKEAPTEKPVFVGDRGRVVTADRAYRRFKRAAKEAGIKGWRALRFHDLKHSTVSGFVARGYSLEMIQAYVGHSTLYMTQRYAHIASKQLDLMADGLTGTISAQNAPRTPEGTTANKAQP